MTTGLAHWIRCAKCEGGMDYHAQKCEHCGHEHSEEELDEARQNYSKRTRIGMYAALIFFPLFVFFVYYYVSAL